MRTSTLKPGLLVALATRVDGGVNYKRVDLDQEHTTDDGSKMARWETTRTIEDPAEFDRATKLRGKCRSLITAVCSASDFGLLCPSSKEPELDAAMVEATRLADDFNRGSARSRVSVYVLKGRIAQDDAEAVRAINGEVRELLSSMERGIAAADPVSIREAATRARKLGGMLTDDAAGKVNAAIEQAREAARSIVKRVEKSGELAATVVAECKLDAIASARFAFLDLEESKPVEALPVPAAGLDLMPEESRTATPAPAVPALEVSDGF